jgi:hypothetical protein
MTAGRVRRDAWLQKFLHDPDGAVPPGVTEADRVLGPTFEQFGEFWNEAISPFFAELYAVSGLEPRTVQLMASGLACVEPILAALDLAHRDSA